MFEILFWAIVFVAFVLAELATVQLVSIWFALGALATLLFTVIFEETGILAQLGVFIIASGIFLLITFPWLKKRHKKGHISTNQELYIGMTATVIQEINGNNSTGRVRLNGVDWNAAPSRSENAVIPVESIVVVEKVIGTKLLVTPKD